MKMYIIDAENRTFREAENTGLESLQGVVGGYIETAFNFPNDDCAYVNEEGLYQGYQFGFMIKGAHQPFMGNGVVVGSNPRTGDDADVKMSLPELQAQVKFLSLQDMRRMYGVGALNYKKIIATKTNKKIKKTMKKKKA
jgi:hypothetical protein